MFQDEYEVVVEAQGERFEWYTRKLGAAVAIHRGYAPSRKEAVARGHACLKLSQQIALLEHTDLALSALGPSAAPRAPEEPGKLRELSASDWAEACLFAVPVELEGLESLGTWLAERPFLRLFFRTGGVAHFTVRIEDPLHGFALELGGVELGSVLRIALGAWAYRVQAEKA